MWQKSSQNPSRARCVFSQRPPQQVRGWLQRRIVQPALAASVGVAKVCGVASAVFVVLRRPLRTIAFIYFLASRLALLAGLLILYT